VKNAVSPRPLGVQQALVPAAHQNITADPPRMRYARAIYGSMPYSMRMRTRGPTREAIAICGLAVARMCASSMQL
jgi:hypothetical protein